MHTRAHTGEREKRGGRCTGTHARAHTHTHTHTHAELLRVRTLN